MTPPREAKNHRARRDGVGPGWDLSAVRVILDNDLYRGRLVWNRSRWLRVPGTRQRRRVPRPEAEWIVAERPELRIVDEDLWRRVRERRAQVRARYDEPRQFGKARAEYGTYPLSGLLICSECGGPLTIRTGSTRRGDQRYGCARHWRRGSCACPNNLHVRRDRAEARIFELLEEKLYCPEAIAKLVSKVNARLRARQPEFATERAKLLEDRTRIRQRLDGLRQFIEGGDTSSRVREWLRQAEDEEQAIEQRVTALDAERERPPIQVLPARVESYLRDLRGTLSRGGPRLRHLLRQDIERIVIHPVRSETAKPFARAEVVTTGKGLLDRVAFVVARAGFEPATFGL